MLDAFCLATGYHWKYALAVLGGRRERKPVKKQAGYPQYGIPFRDALRIAWEASGSVCLERLQPFRPELVLLLEKHGDLAVVDDTRAPVRCQHQHRGANAGAAAPPLHPP